MIHRGFPLSLGSASPRKANFTNTFSELYLTLSDMAEGVNQRRHASSARRRSLISACRLSIGTR
jgi:hypothetical protein